MHSGAYRRKWGKIMSIVCWWWWPAWSLVIQYCFYIKVEETLERWSRISNAFDRTTAEIDSVEAPEKLHQVITFETVDGVEKFSNLAASNEFLTNYKCHARCWSISPFVQSVIAVQCNLLLGRSLTNCSTNCMQPTPLYRQPS